MNLKILHIADLHGNIDWFNWLRRQAPTYDLVCIAGDLLDMKDDHGLTRQMNAVDKLLQDFPASLALCSGNHDMVHEDAAASGRLWLAALRRENFWIDGDRFTLGGHGFRCLGWGNPVPPTHPEEIWITHAPPDGCGVGRNRRGQDLGDFELGGACRDPQGPSMVLCGHIHAPQCWQTQVGRTLVLNPGHAENAPYPNHIVLDFDRGIAQRRRHGHRHEIVPPEASKSGLLKSARNSGNRQPSGQSIPQYRAVRIPVPMLSTKHKLLIGTALLADTVSRTCNLLRIVWCSAMLIAIIITAWRDDYLDHINKWPAALFTSVVLTTKLVRWLRIEF